MLTTEDEEGKSDVLIGLKKRPFEMRKFQLEFEILIHKIKSDDLN